MHYTEFIDTLNKWGSQKIPFLFMVDFEMENPIAIKLAEINSDEILYEINGLSNFSSRPEVKNFDIAPMRQGITRFPLSFKEYQKKFDIVYAHLLYGDSYLTNLTIKTALTLDYTLPELFHMSQAKYKLYFKDQFLVFSPEIFIQIKDGKIFSFPMKGTIDAALKDAKEKIIEDQKELAEHVTIVDLIRNDLSRVATNVSVKRFRYIDEIKTNYKTLLQVSSEITGELPLDYTSRLGNILAELLPAGSVSGAPKPKTVEIIRKSEDEKRGYYTGVLGYFDGHSLDSGVMIRFIEKQNEKYFYRSGGGITTQSIAEAEYQEAVDKVYVPVD